MHSKKPWCCIAMPYSIKDEVGTAELNVPQQKLQMAVDKEHENNRGEGWGARGGSPSRSVVLS